MVDLLKVIYMMDAKKVTYMVGKIPEWNADYDKTI